MLSKEKILDAISKMNVLEVCELVKMMEKKFNVKSNVMPQINPTINTNVKKEIKKTTFDVIMESFGTRKIAVIKIVRSILNLGLKESKDKVESVPVTIKSGIKTDEANKIKEELEKVGAKVTIK